MASFRYFIRVYKAESTASTVRKGSKSASTSWKVRKCWLGWIWLLTYCEIAEEDFAPLILDVSEDYEDADDHGEDDGDHHYQPAVNHLHQVRMKLSNSFKIKWNISKSFKSLPCSHPLSAVMSVMSIFVTIILLKKLISQIYKERKERNDLELLLEDLSAIIRDYFAGVL